jgi:hypothetical protein
VGDKAANERIMKAMKSTGAFLLAAMIASYAVVSAIAQTGAQPQSGKQAPVYVQDGGVSQALESIFIPPMVNAPFTCVLHTEWVRSMPDGGTLTLVNQRTIARESSGRFYQERWLLVPKNGPAQSLMSHIQIADPNNHTLITLRMGTNAGTLTTYGGTTSKVYKPAEPFVGALPDGSGSVMSDALGDNRIQGVDTVGTRITRTTNAWVIGNDRAFTSVREFWFAPSLGINLVSKVSDPRFGSQTFTVTDLTLSEPDPQLFEVVKDFKIQDIRQAPPAQ